ncbi:MAG TPA: c-type cytochrome [Stellaceae bacterium]|nr:c-type cytochrome [Stellaceae bacterium]
MSRLAALLLVIAAMIAGRALAQPPAGDSAQGAKLFGACAACHSLVKDRNMTGPSLAGLWGRKAGSLQSFNRYSPALKSSAVVWGAKTLDAWLASPAVLIPGNRMAFAGMPDARQRADLIAFLKATSTGQRPLPAVMARPPFKDLKKLGPEHQVEAIRYCRDTYHVITADGRTADFWEANLRFKTDSSDTGPLPGKPVIMPAGMMGDRASVFFAAPDEFSTFVKDQC